jgi:hypothetical protein
MSLRFKKNRKPKFKNSTLDTQRSMPGAPAERPPFDWVVWNVPKLTPPKKFKLVYMYTAV